MDSSAAPGPDRPSDPGGALSFDQLFLQGEDFRRRLLWESAIERYHLALKLSPDDPKLRMALGRAYEGKSRDKDASALLLMAMEQYRCILKTNPEHGEAHEALLAAAARAGRLEDLVTEYQERHRRDPNNEALRTLLRKTETLLSMSASTTAPSQEKTPHRLTHFLLNRVLPIASILLFIGSFLIRVRQQAGVTSVASVAMFRSAIFLLVVYAVYKLLMSR